MNIDLDKRRVYLRVHSSMRNWFKRKVIALGGTPVPEESMADVCILSMVHPHDVAYPEKVYVTAPDFLQLFLDGEFKPIWLASLITKPALYKRVIVPDPSLQTSSYDLPELLDEVGLKVSCDSPFGLTLGVLPDQVTPENIEYIKRLLEIKNNCNNLSFVTEKLLFISVREWKFAHPLGVVEDTENFDLQNAFMKSKWEMIKQDLPDPIENFDDGIPGDYVVLDTEYVNVNDKCTFPLVLEIGAIKIRNHQIVDSLSLFVDHSNHPVKHVRKYKYVGKAQWANETILPSYLALETLRDFVGSDLIVGHSIKSDMLVLGMSTTKPLLNPLLDTRKLVRYELAFHVDCYSLPKLAETLDLYHNSHWAIDDALTTYELYEFIVKNRKIKDNLQ